MSPAGDDIAEINAPYAQLSTDLPEDRTEGI